MLTIIRNWFLLLFCMLLIHVHANGQNISNTKTISGKVEVIADSTGLFYSPPNAIENDPFARPGATVIIMDLDSTIVTGSTTNQKNGRFEIKGITLGDYILKTSYIGYEDNYQSLTIGNNDPSFLEITLGNIYCTSELPFHEKQAEDDLNEGIVQFKIWGELIGGPHPLENQNLQEKFGFHVVQLREKYVDVDQQQWEKLRQATIRYNIVVDEYLSEKYPEEWKSLHGIW